MFGAPKLGRFRSLASLILVVNVVGKLQRKRTLAASRGFLAAARLSCYPRDAMLARYVFARVTCLSVRLSHIRSMTLDDLELELL